MKSTASAENCIIISFPQGGSVTHLTAEESQNTHAHAHTHILAVFETIIVTAITPQR